VIRGRRILQEVGYQAFGIDVLLGGAIEYLQWALLRFDMLSMLQWSNQVTKACCISSSLFVDVGDMQSQWWGVDSIRCWYLHRIRWRIFRRGTWPLGVTVEGTSPKDSVCQMSWVELSTGSYSYSTQLTRSILILNSYSTHTQLKILISVVEYSE